MKKIIYALVLCILFCFSACSYNHQQTTPPNITEGQFPFYIEYIYNDETYKYHDAVVCNYVGLEDNHGWSMPQKIRVWESCLQSSGEQYKDILIIDRYQEKSIFTKGRTNLCSFVYLCFGSADYYMGEEKYFGICEPCFYYYESFENNSGTVSGERTILTDEQLEKYFGIKIVRFETSSPIKNEYE